MSDTFDFRTLPGFFEQYGFGGAKTGADIVRMLGEQRGTTISPEDQASWGRDLDMLLGETRAGLGELPGLFSTLTGQVRETARIGGEAVRGAFQAGRGGLQRAALGLGQQFRTGLGRAGFAGSGALRRRRATGRQAIGEQFGELLGKRRTGLGGVEVGLERGLFGAEKTVAGEESSLLAALMGGIGTLREAMRREDVFGGKIGPGGEPSGDTPMSYVDWLTDSGLVDSEETKIEYQDYLDSFEG